MLRFEDLRFSIGVFFLAVGGLLILASQIEEFGTQLNLFSGIGMLVFAGAALGLSFTTPNT
jgi:hypothetical protein